MLGHPRTRRDHQSQGAPVVADVIGTDVRLHRPPRLHLIVEEDAPRLRWIRLVLPAQAFQVVAAPAGDGHVIEERPLAAVDPHAVQEPFLVADQPRQDRRQVGAAPPGIAHSVDGEVVHLCCRDPLPIKGACTISPRFAPRTT